MGNICCANGGEHYKHGAWRGTNGGDAGAEDPNDDAQYKTDATDREQLILLHEQQRALSGMGDMGKKQQRALSDMDKKNSEEKNNGVGECTGCKSNGSTRHKRPPITSTPMEISPSFSFTPPSFPKSPDTTKFLLNTLAHHFVFASIDEETKRQFVSAMQPQTFRKGDWVMHQGDQGDYFYIVEEGEVAFHVREGFPAGCASENFPQVGTGSKGSSFGELALLYNTPRAASIRALVPLRLYRIDQLTFRSLVMSQQVQDRFNLISLVENLQVFQDLDAANLRKLVDAFTIVEFGEGERVVNKGDHGDIFYIVRSGGVKIDSIGHGSSKFQDQILGEGDSFGERALITGETRAANVTAVAKSTLLAISKLVLENIIGPLDQAITNSIHARYLRSIPFFEYLEQDEIDRCVMQMKEERFEKGNKILASGKLYMIQDGHALMMLQEEEKGGEKGQNDNGEEERGSTTGPKLVKLEKGDYFGDLCGSVEPKISIGVAAPEKNENLIITVESNMKCLTLLGSDVRHAVGDLRLISIEPAVGEEQNNDGSNTSRWSHIKFMQAKTSSFDFIKSRKCTTDRHVMNLSKLTKHRIIGIGTFGKVWLVTPKSNIKDKPTPYAVKMISKRQLLQEKLSVTVLREKNVMESIQHPLLMHMVSSFQDENYLYFVMDLVLGGELFELLYSKDNNVGNTNAAWKESALYKSFGPKDDKPIKGLAGVGVRKALFYGACVIDAFTYLHNRRIVYRDLKPENVLLNEKGYCIIVDMGFAKVVLDKTYTMCGTPEYLAPEIVLNRGHNHAADYWSFGCLLYELIVGKTPFVEDCFDQMSLLKRVVRAKYAFPDKITNLRPDRSNGMDNALYQWKDLVSSLLQPKAMERIGNVRNGIKDILAHDWFAKIDVNEVRNQSIPAPWIPRIVDPLDTSHFGNNFGREEKPDLFKSKLSAKDQEVFKDF